MKEYYCGRAYGRILGEFIQYLSGKRMEEKRRERENEEMCSQGKKNGRKEGRYALIGEKEWKKRDEKERTKRCAHRDRRMEGKKEDMIR